MVQCVHGPSVCGCTWYGVCMVHLFVGVHGTVCAWSICLWVYMVQCVHGPSVGVHGTVCAWSICLWVYMVQCVHGPSVCGCTWYSVCMVHLFVGVHGTVCAWSICGCTWYSVCMVHLWVYMVQCVHGPSLLPGLKPTDIKVFFEKVFKQAKEMRSLNNTAEADHMTPFVTVGGLKPMICIHLMCNGVGVWVCGCVGV